MKLRKNLSTPLSRGTPLSGYPLPNCGARHPPISNSEIVNPLNLGGVETMQISCTCKNDPDPPIASRLKNDKISKNAIFQTFDNQY